MRFILTALIWIVIVGGLWLYIYQRDNRIISPAESKIDMKLSANEYMLEITPTFGIEPDPFALVEEGQSPATLVVRLGGKDIHHSEQPLARGETLRIGPVEGLIVGMNELFIQASPPLEESHINHALRLRLRHNEVVEVDQTLWSEAGGKVSGTVSFLLEQAAEADHDHQ